MFQDLLDNHKLSTKINPDTGTGESFGVNVPMLRRIANGQIFFLHPLDNLEGMEQDLTKCHELLDKWLEDAAKVKPWGELSLITEESLLTAPPLPGFSKPFQVPPSAGQSPPPNFWDWMHWKHFWHPLNSVCKLSTASSDL